MSLNRRHLFGLLGGAAVAPLLPQAAPTVAPIVTRYMHRAYGLGYTVSREQIETTTRWMREARMETAERQIQSLLARS